MAFDAQIFTADYVIRGTIETDGERLTDVLNLKSELGIVLLGAQIGSLFTLGKTPPIRLPKARIEKRAILMAIPVQRDLTHKSMFRKANRIGFEVVVLMPQFDIRGTIHLIERMDPRKGLTTRAEDFIPLTDAVITFAPNPQVMIRAETVIFNRHQLSMIGELSLRTGALVPPPGMKP